MDTKPFYNCCKSIVIDYTNADRKFSKSALNDNDIIKLITGLADNGTLKDPLQFGLNDSTPTPIAELCQAICKERPTFPSFDNEDDTFRFIRDRYSQFGGELDEFAQFLADQFPKDKPKTPESAAEPGSVEPSFE